jgi:histidine triad (HIT) family protein
MSDCIFCRIANHEIPSDIVYEDDEVIAFRDLDPQAPIHILIIPKAHVRNLLDVGPDHVGLLGRMQLAMAQVARDQGVAESGFRTVLNSNRDAGQVVEHLHVHLLGGRALGWPPG